MYGLRGQSVKTPGDILAANLLKESFILSVVKMEGETSNKMSIYDVDKTYG